MSATPTRRAIKWGVVGVAAVAVAMIALLATRSPTQATAFESPLLGQQAPATSSRTLGGASVDLAADRGRVVVLNFFASWCPPCREEAPQLNAFAYDQSQLADGATMVGVVFNDADSAAARFVADQGALYPVLVDPDGRIGAAWGVDSPPTTYVIDAKGVVVDALVGPLTASELDAIVAKYQTSARG
jgi:cytochrome c biogenesis protein CcmG/thiol:disulfide interchange protein DsbE